MLVIRCNLYYFYTFSLSLSLYTFFFVCDTVVWNVKYYWRGLHINALHTNHHNRWIVGVLVYTCSSFFISLFFSCCCMTNTKNQLIQYTHGNKYCSPPPAIFAAIYTKKKQKCQISKIIGSFSMISTFVLLDRFYLFHKSLLHWKFFAVVTPHTICVHSFIDFILIWGEWMEWGIINSRSSTKWAITLNALKCT